VSVDHIADVLNARKLNVTISVSMVVATVAQPLLKKTQNCWTMQVLREMVTRIIGMVLILEAIL
jgi:hypothetical protein